MKTMKTSCRRGSHVGRAAGARSGDYGQMLPPARLHLRTFQRVASAEELFDIRRRFERDGAPMSCEPVVSSPSVHQHHIYGTVGQRADLGLRRAASGCGEGCPRATDFRRFSTADRGISTRRRQPEQRRPMSAPSLTTSHSRAPHGWAFLITTRSPMRKSITTPCRSPQARRRCGRAGRGRPSARRPRSPPDRATRR